MTSDTDIHDKLRAVFLAAIMVVSMAAIGATFAGSAAANTGDSQDLAGEEILIGQQLTVDVDDNTSAKEMLSKFAKAFLATMTVSGSRHPLSMKMVK